MRTDDKQPTTNRPLVKIHGPISIGITPTPPKSVMYICDAPEDTPALRAELEAISKLQSRFVVGPVHPIPPEFLPWTDEAKAAKEDDEGE